ncbi:YciI family protein [Phytohabitans sp. ZYX-F-186]|uniref:YciI family protein n=1 Tax=Phytohabitans maris TaxID=3071409 RepID=A0ABU0ZFZ8_9ACTN|nr:YciI family protein [Phytohabitans sp. ZYX-F-186]MDQ7905319.1 YciI family protein [Phytohabitans sp. ZYX-F-186]
MLLLKGDPPTPEGGDSAAITQPPGELISAMMKFNEDLAKAGVLLAAEGLYPSAAGARVIYKDGKRSVVDGPFAEAKELIAGFYLIQVRSKEEAIEWASRCPVEVAVPPGVEAVIEVRQVGETDELVNVTDEQREQYRQLREQISGL